MANAIEELIKTYNPKNTNDFKCALREIIQSIVLIGLSRANFFAKASFYGGTALRIFYGLNRYSEDLDFTLNACDDSFSFEPYVDSIKNVANSYGIDMDIDIKNKKIETPIESAFAKLNTYQTFLSLKINNNTISSLHKDEILKVKFEVDCNPPLGFNVESKWIYDPEFASINVLDLESLFAGKIAAVLCRNYKNTVKGRDYYDYLFYIRKKTRPNLDYLKRKLVENGKINEDVTFTIDTLKTLLRERFETVDFNQVRNDVQRFLLMPENLDYYCKELFIDTLRSL